MSDLLVAAEENPQLAVQARAVARQNNYPLSIYLPTGVFMEALGVEGGQPVYAVIRNMAHPFRDGATAFYEEIAARFDLSSARVNYGNGNVKNPTLGAGQIHFKVLAPGDSLLLVAESTNKSVMAFDLATGDLVDMNFIPPSAGTLTTPIEAQQSPWGTISVSDQIADLVQEFDTSGTYLGILAPAGGVNNAILDNARGHGYRSNGNLLVAVAGGANQDAIAEFDSGGNYLGNFVANGSGGLNGPWSIWFRDNDVLVAAEASDAVHRYDLNGAYLNDFAAVDNFPEQVVAFPNGNVGVGNFSGSQTGVVIYDANGTLLNVFTGVTGNRGVWMLGNGNILTTNGSGVHEIDGTSGALIRTIVSGVSARNVQLYVVGGSAPVLSPPRNLSAQAGDGVVDLTWDAPLAPGVAELFYDDGTAEGNLSIGSTGEGDLAVRFTPNVYPSTEMI